MDLSRATWRKSSRSNSGGNCVEVTVTPTVAGVRDTKDRSAGYFTTNRKQWQAFLDAVKTDRFA
ncbi:MULTISPECIES: DUF397 domain-containing protein [Actinopolyspora]|uniref:Putative secreted Zn-dependent protease n=1 Tax=Actinopolyspora biskrensis TaxID=1470178 RepID=A0A852Z413_9ACTN|nr:DUF397 domain-containing protein [Actinopolyspora halophila]NYH77067.1 putative secreted Zn-dependent protease [Actinopolyspora biskrensis]